MLEVEGLSVEIGGRRVVDSVGFEVASGARLGIIGESGSGKSLTMLAILGLLPEGAVPSGSIRLDGDELLGRSERQLARIRGARVGTVFQDPLAALNPLRTIGRQLVEPLELHGRITRRQRRETAVQLAELVRLPEPATIIDRYPHQLSGGQRQRVAVGIAVACRPGLLLADEPTTALDVTIQAEILGLFRSLVDETDASLVFVTHDLAVLSEVTSEVLVLSHGRVVESASVAQILRAPEHDVTAGLVAAARATSWQPEGGAA